MTGVPAPAGPVQKAQFLADAVDPVHRCERYDCVALRLPPHSHVMVPRPWPPAHPFAACHVKGDDIDRVHVDWKTVAYETWTGHRQLPADGQLTLDDALQAAHG